MQRSSIPLRYAKVWAVDAAGAYIRTVPTDSQIGIQDGAASFSTGFVPDNFSPVAAGGVPPFGQDFNGLLNADTAWMQWKQAGGAIPFNSTFSTAIGGYPQGAIIDSAILFGAQWYSIVDNNTTDPDDPLTSANWLRVGLPAGALVPFLSTVPTGFVRASSALTIGSLASGADYAAAAALFLYVANWSNSQLVIYTSAGVVTSRGANAVADFNANKRLLMPNGRGAGLIGVDADGSSYLSGAPIVAGNTTTPGSTLGENLHALTSGENGLHDHAVYLKDNQHTHGLTTTNSGLTLTTPGPFTFTGGGIYNTINANQGVSVNNASANITIGSVNGVANDNKTASSGSGTGHNTVQRSLGVNWGQKL